MTKKVKKLGLGLIGGALLVVLMVLTLVPKSEAMVETDKTASLTAKPIAEVNANDGIDRLLAATNGAATVSMNRATNVARFVRLGTGSSTLSSALALQSKSPEAAAAAFFQEFGDVFGIKDPDAELIHLDTKTDLYGATRVVYEQVYQGVPVFAGLLYAHFDSQGRLTAVNGAFVPDIAVNTTPAITVQRAANIAISEVLGQQDSELFSVNLLDASNDLLIFRTGLAQGVTGLNYLAYRVEVADSAGSVREFVFVDAHSGKVLEQITGIHEDLNRKIYLEAFDPATLVWQEGDTYPYVGTEAFGINRLIDYAEDTYDMFYSLTGGQVISATAYDSYDGDGATMHSVYNDPRISCPNANWNGVSTNYCTDVDGDDTVAHEWTHAYTEYTHNLIYQWQPGALNESYSDIFGEVVDMINGAGLDTPDGTRAADACSIYTRVPTIVRVNSPAGIAGDYSSNQASFGPTVDGLLTGDVMAADDGSAKPTEACNPVVNDLSGKIAFVRRGTCNFTDKVKNAQDAGAIGVIVANHEDGGDSTFSMSGVDTSITIQSVMVGYTDGNAIEAELGNGVNVTILPDPSINTENSLRWLSGEDDPAFGGAIRDMWNPGCYGDPGEVIEDNYMCGTGDGGGVHTNSGVPNHAFALLVDGGDYNGVTVSQVGLTKTAAIYWRSMSVYQNPATDFAEHADALEQSCTDLIGQDIYDPVTGAVSSAKITAADCTEVANAMQAVEMRSDPTAQCGFTTLLEQNPPNVCEGMGNPVQFYTTTFESGAADWSMSTDVTYPAVEPLMWELTSTLPVGRSGSAFYAIDEQGGSCNADAADDSRVLHLDSPMITIPAATTHARVSFWHWVATESGWDGGNVKISVNDGPWQVVDGRFYTFNPYNGTINTVAAGNTNPISGEEGFTGSDGGSVYGTWGQSQVNVSRYAEPGDTIQLRFDFGSDGCGGLFGWYVDDVDVFYCDAQVDPGVAVFADGVEDHEIDFGISSSLSSGEFEKHTLSILSAGVSDLNWSIDQQSVASQVESLPVIDRVDLGNAPEANSASQIDAPLATFVQDPSFESGADFAAFGGQAPNLYWNSFGVRTICENAVCGANALDGTNYWWPGAYSGAYTSGISQSVSINNTGLAYLTMEVWTPVPVASDMLTVTIDGNVVYTLSGADAAANGFDFYYTTVAVDVSAYADGNAHVLQLDASVDGDNGYGYLIDLVDITDTPTCLTFSNIPWLSLEKTSGVIPPYEVDDVTVFFDATGLASGHYEGNLCVFTDAPDRPVVAVPVSLEVLYERYLPAVFK
jgi:Zn-dependent metalloprotease